MLDNDVEESVVGMVPDTDGAGAAIGDLEAEGRRKDAKLLQGVLLRDKTLACAKQIREIQVRMSSGVDDLAKARAEVLLVKKSILLKKQELTVLLGEEIRVMEVEALMQKRVSSLEEARTVCWMGCADGMASMASHYCDTPSFPGGDIRVEQLARIDAKVAMDAARLAVSKEVLVKPYSQAVKAVKQKVVVKEPKVPQPTQELPRATATMGSGGKTAKDDEQWTTASRRAPV